MTHRPRTHVLETESRAAFNAALPARWVVRDETPDYGIDMSVEIVETTGRVSGKRFFAQLKGTDQRQLRRALSVRLKITTFRYLQGLANPVLVVVYHAPTHALYSRWVHDLDAFYASPSKTDFTFQLAESDLFDKLGGPARIEEVVDEWRWLRSPSLDGPLVLRVNVDVPTVRGILTTEVVGRLQEMSVPLRGVVEVREVPLGRVRGEINITPDDVHVRLYGGAGAAIHRSLKEARVRGRRPHGHLPLKPRRRRKKPDASAPATAEEVAADILATLAMALRHANRVSTAAQVAEVAFADAAISRNTAAAAAMVDVLIAAGRHDAVVRAARALHQAGAEDAAQLAVTAVFVASPPHEGRQALHVALEEWLAGLPTLPPETLGTAHYNVGRYIGVPGWDIRGGVAHFIEAARLYPSYRSRGYFWDELGAMFFHLGRFIWSARAYGAAGQLGRSSSVFAKQADALWRSGRYAEALASIRKYDGLDAHWLLVAEAVPAVIEVSGMDRQLRRPESAAALTAVAMAGGQSPAGASEAWIEVIRADAMSGLAWFNLGVSYGVSAKYEEATLAFLIAALILPNDTEAWANALVSCINWSKGAESAATSAKRIFGLIAAAAGHRDPEGFFQALVRRSTSETAADRELWRGLLGALPEKIAIPPVVRVTAGGQTVEIPLNDPATILRALSAVGAIAGPLSMTKVGDFSPRRRLMSLADSASTSSQMSILLRTSACNMTDRRRTSASQMEPRSTVSSIGLSEIFRGGT